MTLRNISTTDCLLYTSRMSIHKRELIAETSADEKVSFVDTLCASLDTSEVCMSLNEAYNHMLACADTECDKELEQLITLDRVMRQMRAALNSASCYSYAASGAA